MSKVNNPKGRPRSMKTKNAVLDATQRLLAEKGYANLTMEGIAKEAGVGKPTLYRWWSGVPAIVMEVMKQKSEKEIEAPDTGKLAEDLKIYLGKTCQILMQNTGLVMRSLMAESQFNDDFAIQFREEFIETRRNTLQEILIRARERGEISADVDLEYAIDQCYGPIWYRLLNQHAPLDEKFVQSIIHSLLQ